MKELLELIKKDVLAAEEQYSTSNGYRGNKSIGSAIARLEIERLKDKLSDFDLWDLGCELGDIQDCTWTLVDDIATKISEGNYDTDNLVLTINSLEFYFNKIAAIAKILTLPENKDIKFTINGRKGCFEKFNEVEGK